MSLLAVTYGQCLKLPFCVLRVMLNQSMRKNKEEWRDIFGWEGLYEISNLGRLKSLKRLFVPKDRILKTCVDRDGYLFAGLFRNGKRLSCAKVHRLVLEAFVGQRPSGFECRHKDGDKTNNRLSNVEWSTHIVNERDKYNHGTTMTGSKNGYSKLQEADVIEIRKLWGTGNFTQWALAHKFNVGQFCVWSIIHRKTWKHVC